MKLLAPIVAVILVGCKAPTEPQLGETFALRVGETAVIAGTPLQVTFVEVADDSRCALRAQCVWAGDGVVELSVAHRVADPVPVTAMLHTNPDFDQAVTVGAVVLELVELDPYPETPGSIDPDSYRIRVETSAAD